MTLPSNIEQPSPAPLAAELQANAGTDHTSSSNPVLPLLFPESLNPTTALTERLTELRKRTVIFSNFASQLSSYYSQLAKLNQKTVQSYTDIESAPNPAALPLPSLFGVCLATKESQVQTGKAAAEFSNLLSSEVVPKLQYIDRALSNDLNELKQSGAQFKNASDVVAAQHQTQHALKKFQTALESAEAGIAPEAGDPYILRTTLSQRLKVQVSLENKLLSLFASVEQKHASIESSVEKELETVAQLLLRGMQSIAAPAAEVSQNLKIEMENFVSLSSYRQFALNHPESFFGSDVEARSLAAASFRGRDSPIARAVRDGILERRTKFLKTYAASRYVLTPLSLIELNNEGQPTLAISLVDAKLVTDHKHHDGTSKFVLDAKQVDSPSGKRHTWVFRSEEAAGWTRDLTTLLSASNVTERCLAIFGASAFNPDTAAEIGAGAAAGAVNSDPIKPVKGSQDEIVPPPKSLTAPAKSLVHDKAMDAYPVAGVNPFAGAASGNVRVSHGGVLASDIGAQGLPDGSAPPTAVPILPPTLSKTVEAAAEPPLAVSAQQGVVAHDAAPAVVAAIPAAPLSNDSVPEPAFVETPTAAEEPVSIPGPVPVPDPVPAADKVLPAAVAPVVIAPVSVDRARSNSASSSVDSEVSQSHLPIEGSAAWQAERDLSIFRESSEVEASIPEGSKAAEPVEEEMPGAVTVGEVGFLAPVSALAEHTSAVDDTADAASVFSYDRKHRASTYNGEDYEPESVLDPKTERRLTQTSHKDADPALHGIGAARTERETNEPLEEHISRRRSSVSLSGLKRKPSRRATASYGSDALAPLSSPTENKHSLFFESDLPATTSGSAIV